MTIEIIPAADMPLVTAGPGDQVVGVQLGNARRFPMPSTEGLKGYVTRADLYADLLHAEGTLAMVTNDPTVPYNGTYRKNGVSGTGSWTLSADRVTSLETRMTTAENVNTTQEAEIAANTSAIAAAVAVNATQTADIATLGLTVSEREARLNRDNARATSGTGRPWAAVVIGMGQSRNTSRGTRVQQASWQNAKMFVDAVAISEFDFASSNVEHATNWDSVASVVPLAEGTGQSPMVGVASTLCGGKFAAAYLCSVAIGSRKISTLWKHGPRCNMQAAIKRLCELAWADGYQPIVMGTMKHGEADATAATGENTYYSNAALYFKQFQWFAAVAMGKPDYIAPIVVDLPQESNQPASVGTNDTDIKNAIIRLTRDIPGLILAGPASQYPNNTDRVHHTDAGMVMSGERDGRLLRAYYEQGLRSQALRCVDLTISGTTFVAQFNAPVTRDTTLNTGQNLDTANAEDGLQWFDNGSQIAIVAASLQYQGFKITGTLASTPTGTATQQVLRIGCQGVPTATASGANNLAGTVIRRADLAGWQSPYDYTYTNYDWACPQSVTARAP